MKIPGNISLCPMLYKRSGVVRNEGPLNIYLSMRMISAVRSSISSVLRNSVQKGLLIPDFWKRFTAEMTEEMLETLLKICGI